MMRRPGGRTQRRRCWGWRAPRAAPAALKGGAAGAVVRRRACGGRACCGGRSGEWAGAWRAQNTKMEDGGWRSEYQDGKWRMEDGRKRGRLAFSILYLPSTILVFTFS